MPTLPADTLRAERTKQDLIEAGQAINLATQLLERNGIVISYHFYCPDGEEIIYQTGQGKMIMVEPEDM